MEEDLILKKAILSVGGPVKIPEGFRVPVRISRSTAGPGAGMGSVVFSFSGLRIKKAITHDDSEFELIVEGGSMQMTRYGNPFISNVDIIPVAYHCPEQAFFNIDQRCKFNCVYCSSPMLDRNITKGLTPEKIVGMISESKETIEAVAFTSGVYVSVEDTIQRMIDCVKAVRGAYKDIPIGVEPYVETEDQIDRLFDAGATEIKINCECARKDIFQKACPELDYDSIFSMLAHAVRIFGRGSVASNIIVGLGESDDDLNDVMERLSSMGVAPGLRGLRIGDNVRDRFVSAMGINETPSPERLVKLALDQKRIMEEHGLDSRSFRTMCLRCTCCDVTPFVDL